MEPNQIDYEKLGVFYLGRQLASEDSKALGDLLLYDSKDLTTHAVVVGMTGSGKTGLCVSLIEEAAMDRIPVIAIDPKGDIGNLLLTFSRLSAEEFLPWVDPGQATRQGQTLEEYARDEAEKWRRGLARWGQDAERIATLRQQAEFRIYTPGSTAGRPLTILKSFAAPGAQVIEDDELFRERIASTASGLLALLGIEADPLRSREHILVAMILEHAWRSGADVDLGRLIADIQTPPFTRVGVMELDAFFPSRERAALALAINNLLASPSFGAWLQGEPLNIKNLLYQGDQPCVSIISIAHLSDAERMFFVTLLLEEVLAWVRGQSGTTALRAILYMDEVFGYFPPSKNPPSKQPMLTLLKQARAFGLGIVLATQNPVDLDYKGLSNTGTWFLGRLQTERDKARVLDGLEGAAAATGSAFHRAQLDTVLSGLRNRVFLMNNVHDAQPVLFETRWAMSYLRGPLTRQQIQELTQGQRSHQTESAAAASTAVERDWIDAKSVLESSGDRRRLIPAEIPQRFLPPSARVPAGATLLWQPALFARGRLHYVKAGWGVDYWREYVLIRAIKPDTSADDIWERAEIVQWRPEFEGAADDGATFAPVPEILHSAKHYKNWQREVRDYLFRSQPLVILECAELKLVSTPGESESDFKIRLELAASERRDVETERLRQKFGPKLQTLQDRKRRAEEKVAREKDRLKQNRLTSILSTGQSLLGALLGRKKLTAANVGRASTAVKSIGRATSKQSDVARAEESVEDIQARIDEMEEEFRQAVDAMRDKLQVNELDLTEEEIAPRKADISVDDFGLLWLPYRVDESGNAQSAFAFPPSAD